MKKGIIYILLAFTSFMWSSCEEKTDADSYPSPIINVETVRRLYKGQDVTLDNNTLDGATKIVGIVISDHANKNVPAGLVVMQSGRQPAKVRGINLVIGEQASSYLPGDSIVVNIAGSTLTKVNGSLQIKNLLKEAISKVSSGNTPKLQSVTVDNLTKNPSFYESTLVRIYGCIFNRVFGEDYAGDKSFHDGGGSTILLHTEAEASFAGENLPKRAVTSGIVFIEDEGEEQSIRVWPRAFDEMVSTGVDVDPNIPLGKTPIIITGFLTDPTGADGNYEYVQFMATQDIDFEMTPFSMVTCNNAGATLPGGYPEFGWATGGARTYKINLTSGTVAKGHFFYVGANKKIWGSSSTDISAANWIASVMYMDVDGADFGTKTGGLLANSGNPAGIAIFLGTTVNENTAPLDAIFFGGTGGLIYTAGPPQQGYKIANTDRYAIKHPTTNAEQPFFRQGNNTFIFGFPAATNFAKLGGTYNASSEQWTTVRVMTNVPLGSTSTIADLETGNGLTKLE
ncbi:DUF5689 domain-containing protein [Pseudopedobacter sp.]|uniref:DUF5689 domain-containing protein n=1 Tax=Pseudopedobacter sp. TaxID=1936787 RepID=UPI00334040F2